MLRVLKVMLKRQSRNNVLEKVHILGQASDVYNDIPDCRECGMRQTEKKGETLMGSARNLSI